jgi:hypothetical protein
MMTSTKRSINQPHTDDDKHQTKHQPTPPTPQEYTFALTQGDGSRVQGFCRRFLPPAPRVGSRLRYPQVLVLVCRSSWAGVFFKVRPACPGWWRGRRAPWLLACLLAWGMDRSRLACLKRTNPRSHLQRNQGPGGHRAAAAAVRRPPPGSRLPRAAGRLRDGRLFARAGGAAAGAAGAGERDQARVYVLDCCVLLRERFTELARSSEVNTQTPLHVVPPRRVPLPPVATPLSVSPQKRACAGAGSADLSPLEL